MNVFLSIRGAAAGNAALCFPQFPERRKKQEWTTGKSKGKSGETISYYFVCRAVAPFTVRGSSVP